MEEKTKLKIIYGVFVVVLLMAANLLVVAVTNNDAPADTTQTMKVKATPQVSVQQQTMASAPVKTQAAITEEDDDEADDENEAQVSSVGAKITQSQAREIATTEIGGRVSEVDTDSVDGKAAWEIEITKGGDVADVLIDMQSGEILSVEWESDEEDDD